MLFDSLSCLTGRTTILGKPCLCCLSSKGLSIAKQRDFQDLVMPCVPSFFLELSKYPSYCSVHTWDHGFLYALLQFGKRMGNSNECAIRYQCESNHFPPHVLVMVCLTTVTQLRVSVIHYRTRSKFGAESQLSIEVL